MLKLNQKHANKIINIKGFEIDTTNFFTQKEMKKLNRLFPAMELFKKDCKKCKKQICICDIIEEKEEIQSK